MLCFIPVEKTVVEKAEKQDAQEIKEPIEGMQRFWLYWIRSVCLSPVKSHAALQSCSCSVANAGVLSLRIFCKAC